MGSVLRESVADLKGYIGGTNNLFPIEGVAKSAKEVRESILTAISTSELFPKEAS